MLLYRWQAEIEFIGDNIELEGFGRLKISIVRRCVQEIQLVGRGCRNLRGVAITLKSTWSNLVRFKYLAGYRYPHRSSSLHSYQLPRNNSHRLDYWLPSWPQLLSLCILLGLRPSLPGPLVHRAPLYTPFRLCVAKPLGTVALWRRSWLQIAV